MEVLTIPQAWDETLTVGELVTAYEKGYHVIVKIEPRAEYAPLVYYRRVVSEAGSLIKTKTPATLCCDAAYVRRVSRVRVDVEWSEALEAAHTKRDNLLRFVTS